MTACKTCEATLIRGFSYCPFCGRPATDDSDGGISTVYMICNAYESGYGHGCKNDGLVNPYPYNSCEYEAYSIGYDAGNEERMSNIFDEDDEE